MWSNSFYKEGTYTICSLSFAFKVAGSYQADNYSANVPAVNTTITGTTSMAVTNANTVVTKNATKSDYEKLTAYRDYICDEVSYNSDAGTIGSLGGLFLAGTSGSVSDGYAFASIICFVLSSHPPYK